MRGWYIAPVIGTGAEDDPYRPGGLPADHKMVMGMFRAGSTELRSQRNAALTGEWMLCHILRGDPAEDAEHIAIPDRDDETRGDLTAEQRETMVAAVKAKGVAWEPPLDATAERRGSFVRAIKDHLARG